MSVLLAATAALLFAMGTWLLLQRQLSRIIIGVGLVGHGANLLLITSGRRGVAPLIGTADESAFADPLPQALVLTGIVITFGVTTFLLALAYRSWLLTKGDEVEDDIEDRIIGRQGALDEEVQDHDVADVPGGDTEPEPAAEAAP